MTEITKWIALLASPEPATRQEGAEKLYGHGCALGDAAVARWRADEELAALFCGPPTVGLAVTPERFEAVHAALGRPRLAEVPPDQDAREFEVQLGDARLDILTTRGGGAIEKFLSRSGESIQQVEYPVRDVDRASALLVARYGVKPIYPATRAGADGTRVNFFFVSVPGTNRKVLIELVEK